MTLAKKPTVWCSCQSCMRKFPTTVPSRVICPHCTRKKQQKEAIERAERLGRLWPRVR